MTTFCAQNIFAKHIKTIIQSIFFLAKYSKFPAKMNEMFEINVVGILPWDHLRSTFSMVVCHSTQLLFPNELPFSKFEKKFVQESERKPIENEMILHLQAKRW